MMVNKKPVTQQQLLQQQLHGKGIQRPDANVILSNNATINTSSGIKRLPIVKIAPNQTQNYNAILRGNVSGKSLLDAHKLKAVKQQQLDQQLEQSKQILQMIPQDGNKPPIVITVGKSQIPLNTQQQSASNIEKTYKNKDDFISSEIPNELFEGDNSQVSIYYSQFSFFIKYSR